MINSLEQLKVFSNDWRSQLTWSVCHYVYIIIYVPYVSYDSLNLYLYLCLVSLIELWSKIRRYTKGKCVDIPKLNSSINVDKEKEN